MDADWKRKMSLIQTRWPSEKSSQTHRTTENALYAVRDRQPSVADGGFMKYFILRRLPWVGDGVHKVILPFALPTLCYSVATIIAYLAEEIW